ncbi:response regulator transcription factor [Winogradskyella schleiferi]|uniref:response regulator transcription factor n=1 Tax=Winogradskyella schleiferi TaxID=2686078 RepID=UPI0015BC1837|nr:response regulator transcription factor [Winogradskyella schleiferi]
MFKKVLIVDDHDAISTSVHEILSGFDITNIEIAHYGDEAFLKIKRAAFDADPFDLLITDLSFKKDHRNTQLESGEELIATIRKEFQDMSIIVYSMSDKLQKVRHLLNAYGINAYVCKDRKGSMELAEAIKSVSENERFLSPQVSQALHPNNDLEIYDYDIHLLRLLSEGLSQDEISNKLKANDISPNSLSTIEKRLNKLRIQFKANNAIHLVATAKDLGLI